MFSIILLLILCSIHFYPIVLAQPENQEIKTLIPEEDGTYEQWEPFPSSESGTDYYYVDGWIESRLDWTRNGSSPYLDAIDNPTNTVYTKIDMQTEGDWGFENSTRTDDYVITASQLDLYCYQEGTLERVNAYAWDGNAWVGAGDGAIPESTYAWEGVQDVSEWINTWEKVNGCKMYIIYYKNGASDYIYVDAGRLTVYWTRDLSTSHYDKIDDPVGDPDDDTTLVGTLSESSSIVKDTYETENISELVTINYVRVFVRGQAKRIGNAYSEYQILLRTHGTDYLGDDSFKEESEYMDHYQDWTVNPNTNSAWTVGEINSLQVGVQGKSANTGSPLFLWIQAKVTQVYVNVSYSTIFDCNQIGLDNTFAGSPTNFYSDWTDLNVSFGLSHFLFSTNNTGTWVNDTWTDSWQNDVWGIATKTLNSTVNIIVAFRFFVNDSSGTEYPSTICFFTTEEQSTGNGFGVGAGAGSPIPYLTYILNILIHALRTTEGRITIAVYGGGAFVVSMLIFGRKKERRNFRIKKVETS